MHACLSDWQAMLLLNQMLDFNVEINDVNKEFLFQHVYGSLPTSVFDRVGVLRVFLCVRYGYCSQALFSSNAMDFIVHFLCLQ